MTRTPWPRPRTPPTHRPRPPPPPSPSVAGPDHGVGGDTGGGAAAVGALVGDRRPAAVRGVAAPAALDPTHQPRRVRRLPQDVPDALPEPLQDRRFLAAQHPLGEDQHTA